MSHSYYIIFIVLLFLLLRRQNQTRWLMRHIQKRNAKEKTDMLELASRFLDKECIVYTFNSQLTGTVREVTDGALLLENGGTLEAVNLDFIIRIREYPRKKNGQKKAVVLD